ncbi:MAG: pilus assembly protein [Xanthomonadales bacterium]|nr:pilus assembly protein [Xanthomonadales bacterium]
MKNQFNPKRVQLGQGMTEYIIITALIAIAAIGAFTLFGKTVRNQTAGMAAEMGGTSSKSSLGHARKAGKLAAPMAKKDVTLGTYNETATGGGR